MKSIRVIRQILALFLILYPALGQSPAPTGQRVTVSGNG